MNPRIFALALGVAIGYVLGTRDGRERYDAMKAKVTALWEDPRVARARKDVEEYARQQAPVIRARAEAAAKDAAAKTAATAKDVASKTTAAAKDVAAKVTDVAADAREQATKVVGDVRDQATKVAADLRERGEAVVDSAVTAASAARDRVLDALEDDEETDLPKA